MNLQSGIMLNINIFYNLVGNRRNSLENRRLLSIASIGQSQELHQYHDIMPHYPALCRLQCPEFLTKVSEAKRVASVRSSLQCPVRLFVSQLGLAVENDRHTTG